MGAMTLFTNNVPVTQGVTANGKRYVDCELAPSASYATGGETFPLASLGLKRVTEVYLRSSHLAGAFGNRTGLSHELDATDPENPKLKLYDADDTEVPNATNLALRILPLRIVGH